MPLIDAAGRILSDPWRSLDDAEPVPPFGPVLLSLNRWQAERGELAGRADPIGVVLRSSDTASDVPELERLALIALEFPKFTDGRPYSTARLLRERHGYRGELRAVGAVLRDQLQFLKRCGFDSFALANEPVSNDIGQAFADITVAYQRAADDTPRAAELRAGERSGYEESKVCAAYWAY